MSSEWKKEQDEQGGIYDEDSMSEISDAGDVLDLLPDESGTFDLIWHAPDLIIYSCRGTRRENEPEKFLYFILKFRYHCLKTA